MRAAEANLITEVQRAEARGVNAASGVSAALTRAGRPSCKASLIS